MGTVSILMPLVPMRSEQMLPYAALVQWTSAARLWQGHSPLIDPLDSFTQTAGAGFRVPAGIGVALMPYRHPMQAALQFRSLALATGHPVVAGFSPGDPRIQEALLGRPYDSPLRATREYVSTVRRLLAGEHVRLGGDYVRCDMSLYPLPHPGVEVGVGMLRPRMARVAGEVADTAITWLAPASYLREELIPRMREGAAEAGRPAPRVAAIVPMCVDAPDRDPLQVLTAGSSSHLSSAHYQDMLRRAGVAVDPEDLSKTAEQVIEAGAFLTGDPTGLAGRISDFHDAGADEVVINLTGTHQLSGTAATLAEIETVLKETEP
ncbi:LLM class flavin-dependent oxidoreductase [Streptomonospora wellingtoniae]|uniref:LLM class flavin-dependent oxidoreductase n=1 Tax=Streptomonospora wellingtoniae TaxID=3075544 RepID=A0ABU2KNU6_9ACTN|nr:LLM class flavin-dependent oxidoreductase [Streptomonospora sp. DSM 45055]MDT0300939.1 LLM class flavin-dependent oxidoreductase [Streptomonospora sp. DSM 45055]